MMIKRLVVAAAAAVSIGAAVAAPAQADPACAEFDVCQYEPPWNGQLQKTWDVPPYTWPNNQLQCYPTAGTCAPAVRGGR
jgi:hypothetical protein